MINPRELLARRQVESIWVPSAPYAKQLEQKTGIGELQRENNVGELRRIFRAGLLGRTDRFSVTEQNLLLDTFDLMTSLHEDQPRRRTGAEVATHPAKVATMNLRDPDVDIVNTAIRLLHDTIEDDRIKPGELNLRLRSMGYTESQAGLIEIGCWALSAKMGEVKLTSEEYDEQIMRINGQLPRLRLVEIKADDRASNLGDDIVMLLDHRDQADEARILDYLNGKVARVRALAKTHIPRSPSTARLVDFNDFALRLKPGDLSSLPSAA